MGSIGYGFVKSLRIHQHVMYGVEQHFENPCDGYFSELDQRKAMANQEHVIEDLEGLVHHLTRLGDEARTLDPQKHAETILEFEPP